MAEDQEGTFVDKGSLLFFYLLLCDLNSCSSRGEHFSTKPKTAPTA